MIAGNDRFGAYMRELRLARRLTLEDVERKTRGEPEPVTRSLLSRLENGRARISAIKLMALARLYGVRLATLAERLELEHQLGCASSKAPRNGARFELREPHSTRCERRERLQEAMRLAGTPDEPGRSTATRARLTLARLLAEEGRMRAARQLLGELDFESLSGADRGLGLLLLAESALYAGHTLVARGALSALRELPGPMQPETRARLSCVASELIDREGGRTERLEAWLETLDAARAASDGKLTGRSMLRLAAVEREARSWSRALGWCEQARLLAASSGDQQQMAAALTERGKTLGAAGRADSARSALRRARHVARRADLGSELFEAYLELWRLAVAGDERVEARACLRTLRHLSRHVEDWSRGAADLVRALDRAAAAGGSEQARVAGV